MVDHFAAAGEPMSIEAIKTSLHGDGYPDGGWVAEELSHRELDRTEYRSLKRIQNGFVSVTVTPQEGMQYFPGRYAGNTRAPVNVRNSEGPIMT